MTETRATSRFVRLTAQKARLVVALIRGKPVEAAMALLEYTPKRGAKVVLKTLRSAVANAEATQQADVDVLYVHIHQHATVRLSFWVAFPVTLAVAAGLGWLIERLVMRPFAKAPMVTMIIVTLGLNLLLTAVAQQVFGTKDLVVSSKHAIFSRAPVLSLGGFTCTRTRRSGTS